MVLVIGSLVIGGYCNFIGSLLVGGCCWPLFFPDEPMKGYMVLGGQLAAESAKLRCQRRAEGRVWLGTALGTVGSSTSLRLLLANCLNDKQQCGETNQQ